MYTYRLIFFTGTLSWSGTNANVDLTLYGPEGESEVFVLKNKGIKTFESGMKNSFTIDTKHSLGDLTKVRVGHDNSGLMPAWFLEKILVEDLSTGEFYEFNCYKWFDIVTGDRKIRRYLRKTRDFEQNEDFVQMVEAEDIVEESKDDMFEIGFKADSITFYTGTMAFAGTDANVSATIYGTDEQNPEEFTFENKGKQTFEKGMKNSFSIESEISLDNLTKLRVYHDNAGVFPGWYLAQVELENSSSGMKVTFPCNQWLWSIPFFGKGSVCDLTGSEEDNKDGPSLIPTSPNPPEVEEIGTLANTSPSSYTIHIVSEVSYGSLSDDKIIFTLYGKNGQSEDQTFDQHENIVFEKRMRGTMELECPSYLGPIEKIRIGLDDSKGTLPWILVIVVDNKLNESVVFICDCCLVSENDAHAQHDHFPVFDNVKNDVLALDKDQGDDWALVKQTENAVVRSRSDSSPNKPPFVKAELMLDDVPWPYQTAVKYFTDWDHRKTWDKTLEVVKVLEKIGDFTLVQCTLKMPFYATKREMVLACLDHSGQQYHVQTMCNALHPRVQFNNKQIRAKSFRSGIVIHKSDENKSAIITVISQVELGGWMQSKAKTNYLADTPVKQIDFLKTYLQQRKLSIKLVGATKSMQKPGEGVESKISINETKSEEKLVGATKSGQESKTDEEVGSKIELELFDETKPSQETDGRNGIKVDQNSVDNPKRIDEPNSDSRNGRKFDQTSNGETQSGQKPSDSGTTSKVNQKPNSQNGTVQGSQPNETNENTEDKNANSQYFNRFFRDSKIIQWLTSK